jgi:hypothetical protein
MFFFRRMVKEPAIEQTDRYDFSQTLFPTYLAVRPGDEVKSILRGDPKCARLRADVQSTLNWAQCLKGGRKRPHVLQKGYYYLTFILIALTHE